MAWGFLALAISIEVLATSLIGRTDGFSRLVPTVLVLGLYGLSFACLAQAIKSVPISTAYAVWSGLGTAAIAAIGFAVLDEHVSAAKISGIALVVVGVVIINLQGGH